MKRKKSFTLIETIVVVAVIGITLPVLFAIILTLMREQVKIYRLSQIKREGDYLLSLMENSIKGTAVTAHSAKPANVTNVVCDRENTTYLSSSLYFMDQNEQWFGYEGGSNTIASDSAGTSINLTSSKSLVSNFIIGCTRSSIYSPLTVTVGFDICYDAGAGNCNSTRPEDTATLHYQTRIKFNNY